MTFSRDAAGKDPAGGLETLQQALEAARIGYWSWDIGSGKVTWSANLESIHKLPPGSFTGNFPDYVALIHADDRWKVEEAIQRAVSGGTDYDIDFRVVPPEGAVQWINGRGHVVLEEGKPVRMIGIGMNVTERKRSDEARHLLAAVVGSSDDAIISKDLEGRILSWNAAAERLFGYASEEVVGKSIQMLMPPDRLEDFGSILQRIRRGERVSHYETVRRHKDGHLVEVALTVSPIHDESGKVVGASKIASDLTAIKHEERERQRTRELVLGTLGHDLRNPLNAVTASLYSLKKHAPEPQQHVVGRMLRSCERMARMIDQLLDFTRARLGEGIPLEPRPADLREICASVVEETETRYPNRIRLRADGDFRGDWDGDRVSQIVSNLVTNALDHGSSTGPVEVDLAKEDGVVRLDVSNSGEPIPQPMRETIFEPFRRASAEASGKGRGLGLGLYITREIVRSHGGSIEILCRKDRTTFSVKLPERREGTKPA